jgi:hypothetical protein
LAVAVPVLVAGGVADFALPLLPFDAVDEFALPFADVLPDDGAPCCWGPLPFCVLAPDVVEPLAFAGGGCGAAAGLAVAVEEVSPVLSAWLAVPAEPVVAAGPCCGPGGELAGAGGGTLLFAGLVTPASSNAAKGWPSIFWLCAEAAAEEADAETAAEALGAILGTLGTLELRRRRQRLTVCLQPPGQVEPLERLVISISYIAMQANPGGKHYAAVGNICRICRYSKGMKTDSIRAAAMAKRYIGPYSIGQSTRYLQSSGRAVPRCFRA